jgi:hypothetical protein
MLDWDKDESVVVPPRKGIAVFLNTDGDVVILQQAAIAGDHDDAVVFSPSCAKAIIAEIRKAAGGK